jgi:hypothetical protein
MGGTAEDQSHFIEQYHLALGKLMKGNHEPAKAVFSKRDDVTLGNPFGPFARGYAGVVDTMKRAAKNYRDGDADGFDLVSRYDGPDLVCIVEMERLRSKVGGREDVTPLALRVTTVFRREDGRSRIAHRHADPIATAQAADSVLRTS